MLKFLGGFMITSKDNQIIKYINNLDYSKTEKATLLKSIGFNNYDRYLIDYINNLNISKIEKSKMLKDMGFTIREGKVLPKLYFLSKSIAVLTAVISCLI